MTTARAATRRSAPAKRAAEKDASLPELTPGERLAADLRVLADLAAATPPVADDLTDALKEVTVVLRVNGGPQHDVLAAALVERAATETPAQDHDELFFREQAWLLPNRAITLSAVSLHVSVDDIEAAGR